MSILMFCFCSAIVSVSMTTKYNLEVPNVMMTVLGAQYIAVSITNYLLICFLRRSHRIRDKLQVRMSFRCFICIKWPNRRECRAGSGYVNEPQSLRAPNHSELQVWSLLDGTNSLDRHHQKLTHHGPSDMVPCSSASQSEDSRRDRQWYHHSDTRRKE